MKKKILAIIISAVMTAACLTGCGSKTEGETKKIENNSDYVINLIIGALIGFENGEIEDLITDGEVLIK